MRWEKGAPSPGLVDFLATHKLAGRVLVPGCGWAMTCARFHAARMRLSESTLRRRPSAARRNFHASRTSATSLLICSTCRRALWSVRLGLGAHLLLRHRSHAPRGLRRLCRSGAEPGRTFPRGVLHEPRQRQPGQTALRHYHTRTGRAVWRFIRVDRGMDPGANLRGARGPRIDALAAPPLNW